MLDLDKMPSSESALCNDETYEEVWNKKMYSVCYKCPFRRTFYRYIDFDSSYLGYKEMENRIQEAVRDVCTKYELEKIVRFTPPERRPMNLKKARQIR